MKTVIIVFVALNLIASVYFCEETPPEGKPDLSEEKRKLHDESEDEETKVEPLTQIDADIRAEFKNPTGLDTSFEVQLKILKHIVNYYNRLEHLYNGVKNDIYEKLTFARDLEKEGGPKFTKEKIDVQNLKKVYNWDDANLEFFQEYIIDIKALWDNITICLKEKPSPMKIFQDNRKFGF